MKKTIWGEGGYKKELKCGCILGEYECLTARTLWAQYLSLRKNNKIKEAAQKRQEYCEHLDIKDWGGHFE
jgi:hypothetical protein